MNIEMSYLNNSNIYMEEKYLTDDELYKITDLYFGQKYIMYSHYKQHLINH